MSSEGKGRISLGGDEILIIHIPLVLRKKSLIFEQLFMGHSRRFWDIFGILFTKNALQSVLQGISAERTRTVND